YKEGTNQIINRYLRINQYPIDEKRNTPIDEKVKDNNTSINNTFNNTKEYIRELPPSKKSKAKPIRHKYGEYKNVLLSDEQMEKLKIEFPNDYQERIERLSEYCESSGKTYKNYLATIRSWARKEKSEPKNASSGYKRTGRREKLPEWAIDQEAYLKKKALERANRQSKAPF
ncbi:TPA: helix-turn-helix domain-containing protein, partial [Enterococcus faecium]